MRIWRVVLSPELFWLGLYLAVSAVTAQNAPPTESFNAWLETLWYAVPVFGVPLSFVFFAVPRVRRGWLLARINAACLAGLFFTAIRVTNGIDYQDSRNSGVLAGFVISLGLGILVLGAMDIVTAALLLLSRRRKALAHAPA